MIDSSAVAGVANWIGHLIRGGQYLSGVREHVGELEKKLRYMYQLLLYVEANPHLVHQNGQLKNFTHDIRELAFHAEDAVDTYIVDVTTKTHRDNILLRHACLTTHFYPIHKLRKEIAAIQQETTNAVETLREFTSIPIISQLQENDIGGPSSRPIPTVDPANFVDEVVVGIDDAISQLANRLTDPKDDFKVVGIVGTGGAGKTTLAKQLFHHDRVESWFPYKAFVSVSLRWSKIDLLQKIFKQLKPVYKVKERVSKYFNKDRETNSSDELVRDLKDFLKKNKCLIVLDDIWKKEAWDDIYHILAHSEDCRVILTTRNDEVPRYADTKCIIHEPKLLTDDQKWELLHKLAINGRLLIENNVEFEKLGRTMLNKCEGLPLAVVTLAGILRTKQELCQWEDISKDCNKRILKGKGGPNYGRVEDMLEMSYLDLPSHLKQCFLYLAIYCEDWYIHASGLMALWIAEGYITNDMQMKQETLEEAAIQSLDELAQRCILQVAARSANGRIRVFRLHDLMRVLCIEKATEYGIFGMVSSTNPDVGGSSQSRRMVILSREYNAVKNNHLRTLVRSGKPGPPDGVIRNMESIHTKFRLLRVLKICKVTNSALPKQIGQLIHLRYLGIIGTNIRKLPKSIKNLQNLMYLYYLSDEEEVEVPDNLVCNMENLRILCLPSNLKCGFIREYRLGLSSETLQALSSGAGTWMKIGLPTLSPTVKHLKIEDIHKLEELEAIYKCPGILEDRLSTFTCSFSWMVLEEDLRFDLEKLKDCTRLGNLDLEFPVANSCMGTLLFPPNLVELCLTGSHIEQQQEDLMQILGELSTLKVLSLTWNVYLGKQLSCARSAFPQLQELSFVDLQNLEEWIMEEGAMARLSKLDIICCKKLKRLPASLRFITTLTKLRVLEMPEDFCSRIGNKGDDSYIIQHIPSFTVTTTPNEC